MGRALAHGALDFMSLGLWEVVGTPMECLKGTSFVLSILYDAHDNATKITKLCD